MSEIFKPKIHWLCSYFNHKWQLSSQSSSFRPAQTYVHDRSHCCKRGCSVSLKVFNHAAIPEAKP